MYANYEKCEDNWPIVAQNNQVKAEFNEQMRKVSGAYLTNNNILNCSILKLLKSSLVHEQLEIRTLIRDEATLQCTAVLLLTAVLQRDKIM